MLPNVGQKIKGLPRKLNFVRDLEAFDGPILSEYKADGGSVYLEKWCDRDDDGTERSLVVRTERRPIAEYLARRISMRQLLLESSDGVGFIVDRNGDSIQCVFMAMLNEVPSAYLPQGDAFHEVALRPKWATYPQNFLLDENWDAKLIARTERLYLDVNAFCYWTGLGTERHLPAYILNYNYDGGYPIVTAFNNMRVTVPQEMRAKSVGVSAGSPGVLTIDAPSSIANPLIAILERLPDAADAYYNVYKWSRFKPKTAHEVPRRAAIDDLRRLCEKLGVDAPKLLPVINDSPEEIDPARILVAGKLVAAYYRRLRMLLGTNSGVEFVEVEIKEILTRQGEFLFPVNDDEDDDYDDDIPF